MNCLCCTKFWTVSELRQLTGLSLCDAVLAHKDGLDSALPTILTVGVTRKGGQGKRLRSKRAVAFGVKTAAARGVPSTTWALETAF